MSLSSHHARTQVFSTLYVGDIIWFVAINALIFENPLISLFSSAAYIDEAITILLLCGALCHAIRSPYHKASSANGSAVVMIILLVLLLILGVTENYVYRIQIKTAPIIVDCFSCIKFPLALLTGSAVFDRHSGLFNLLVIEARVLIIIMFPFAILNQFLDLGMRFDQRFGIYSFQFVFSHPAELAIVMTCFSSLLAVDLEHNKVWLLLSWMYMILTLRTIAIAVVAISFFVLIVMKNGMRIRISTIFAVAVIAVLVGWNQFSLYFGTTSHARRALYDAAIDIARIHFPFGTGFATFGSNVTADPRYYSPLYFAYGLNNIYGLSVSDPQFLSDTFWPIILGQFGWIGVLMYSLCIILMIRFCVTNTNEPSKSIKPISLIFAYLILSSVSSSSFFAPTSIFAAITLGLLRNYKAGGQERLNSIELLH